ncbi:MAG: Sec-independent protein translocase protein TatB [Desulfovibrionaceae bacterium]|nr:Sec-independent protein translocase protein TatB [Desulfovibrionaceae bacterium]
MFGIGGTELLVIFIVALLVLGPQSLPGIANAIGKAMGEFRRASTDFQRTLNAEAAAEEKKTQKDPDDPVSNSTDIPDGVAGLPPAASVAETSAQKAQGKE